MFNIINFFLHLQLTEKNRDGASYVNHPIYHVHRVSIRDLLLFIKRVSD